MRSPRHSSRAAAIVQAAFPAAKTTKRQAGAKGMPAMDNAPRARSIERATAAAGSTAESAAPNSASSVARGARAGVNALGPRWKSHSLGRCRGSARVLRGPLLRRRLAGFPCAVDLDRLRGHLPLEVLNQTLVGGL